MNGYEGTTVEGVLGYMYVGPQSNALNPIYRCNLNGKHLTTNALSECVDNGYIIEGLQGYVPN